MTERADWVLVPREWLERIGRVARVGNAGLQDGSRTLDYCMMDLSYIDDACRAMLDADPPPKPREDQEERELVARIIDPQAFMELEAFTVHRWGSATDERRVACARIQSEWRPIALTKADAILSTQENWQARALKAEGERDEWKDRYEGAAEAYAQFSREEEALHSKFTKLVEAVSTCSGEIISGSIGPLFNAGFSAGVKHVKNVVATVLAEVSGGEK